jgi:Na+/H+-dicarboxylate symporter
MFHLPATGVAMVLAIDQILDMGRTMTNVIGNSVATAVIAKWESARRAEANDYPLSQPKVGVQ